MVRPMIGDKPLTASERARRHRQKLRGNDETTPKLIERSAEELLKEARREIVELRREIDRLRGDAGLTTRNTPKGAPPTAPVATSHDASASALMGEDVEAESPPSSIWAAVKRAEQLLKAGKPL